MRSSTLRRVAILLTTPAAVAGTIVTLGGFVASVILTAYKGRAEDWLLAGLVVIVLGFVSAYLVYRRGSSRLPSLFLPVTFDELNKSEEAILEEIMSGQAAAPEFAPLLPMRDEFDIVCDELLRNLSAIITGGPGEGKSALALQIACWYHTSGFRIIQLNVAKTAGLPRARLSLFRRRGLRRLPRPAGWREFLRVLAGGGELA
jgi:hypothetical protein